jgi:outer membrane protein assembly factor BamB
LLAACLAALVSGCGPSAPGAALHGGRVIVQAEFQHAASSLDAKSGKSLSRFAVDGWADAPPTADGLVFTHGDAGVVARDVRTGEPRWRVFMKGAYFRRPVLGGAEVFVFDPRQSQHAWRGFRRADGRKAFDVACDDGAPLAADAEILVTLREGRLSVRSAADGKERYRTEVEAEPPLLVGGERFFARVDDALGVFKVENGRLVRTIDLGDTDVFSVDRGTPIRLVTTGDLVAFVGDDVVGAVDASTGKRRWTREVEDADRLALDGDLLAVAADDQILGFDVRSGSKRWQAAASAGIAGLSAGDGAVAARTSDGLVVLDGASGRRRFEHDVYARAKAP